jgi:SAM-dependent methyltransferase
VPVRSGGRLLDLGAGSGVQGLLRGDARTRVTAIDINPRAVAFTKFNATLNGRPRVHAEIGDFLADEPDPSLDGRFDTVIANPPFVLSPVSAMAYRDRPLPGDRVGERTAERVARALAPRGRGYVLCNWIDGGASWSDPVRRWTSALRCDVTVTRIRSLEPLEYASIWTRWLPADERLGAAGRWATALLDEGIARIHVGVIEIARAATGQSAWFDARLQAIS